ncbi:Ubiquinone/menaquinone biosynthesis C-methylase UbiE [Aquimarina amphilecti]|uniref:Ubiquinone/menaquinone biosynthesis C-methylase UbiE n=1 Tax=Aquimarina amphilecti TaxID=1038014 RepID=A0A1H7UTT7_AQUAM|nr:methyltransferase domain-containing protein [Aquimarina amphilecti]SEM00371.1 Ubiquinone/menaquinone biosynthesis C-methylase UbiE [Aquimarina amphilecti]
MSTTFPLLHKIRFQKSNKENLIELYDEATEDYEFWSKDFNMHFGYYIPFKTTLFKRDTMLNEMNNQIFNRLSFNKKNGLIADLGCGIGGTMRYGLRKYPRVNILGITLSSFQVTQGNKRLENMNGLILKENYNHTSFASNSFDSAYAIESYCHSGHSKKVLNEAYRIIKPGGKLVIADAFLKKDEDQLCPGSHYCYDQLCKGWSLEGLGSIHRVKKSLEEVGFKNITIKDVSFRVAPSVLHVPFAITGFILKKLFKRETLKPQSWKNLKGSLFALLSGLHMKSFGYYIITAEK